MADTCPCSLAGLLSINYQGIISASLDGNTEVNVASDGTVLIGPTTSTLNISGYAFLPGGDRYLGAKCPSGASAQIRWIQRYDCTTGITHFIPQAGGKASITGGPINGVSLECDPNIESKSFSANAGSGPTTPYLTSIRRDGFNLIYAGTPIPIASASPAPYSINLGPFSVQAYLQSFNLSVSPPSPTTVNYSFVVSGKVL